MYIRDTEKRNQLFKQSIDKMDEISTILDPIPITNSQIKQWKGSDIKKYLNIYTDLNDSDIELQILFEKRSSLGNEKFPAQISLPGGKRENKETLLETAIRETLEETGINVDNEWDFAYCGEFPNVLPFMKVKDIGNIYVKGFIFFRLIFDPIPIITQKGEIDECLWTSIDYLRESPDQFYEDFECKFFPNTPTEFKWILPSIKLFDSENFTLGDLYKNPEIIREDFKLWGLSLFFIIDLMKFAKYIERESDLKRFSKFYYYRIEYYSVNCVENIMRNYVHKYDPLTHNRTVVNEFLKMMMSNAFRKVRKEKYGYTLTTAALTGISACKNMNIIIIDWLWSRPSSI